MTKKPPIREDDNALSNKELLRRWLYCCPQVLTAALCTPESSRHCMLQYANLRHLIATAVSNRRHRRCVRQ